MPISADEWNKGRKSDTWESKIEKFLRENMGKAFSRSEIFASIGSNQTTGNNLLDFVRAVGEVSAGENALQYLIREGIVNAKVVKTKSGKEIYYAIPR